MTTTTTSAMGGIVRRKEDPALIAGKGRYVDDMKLNGETAAVFVRSPFAHARINSIDTSAAEALPGVRAVVTAADFPELPAGHPERNVSCNLMARDRVRYEGQALAAVAKPRRLPR